MRPAHLLILTILVPLLAVSCGGESQQSTSGEPTFETEGTLTFYDPSGEKLRTIDIEIADTATERERGLMRRRTLGFNRGMLFIFDEVDRGGMWMKNTPLPLDIVFVAPDSQVINIARRTTPFSENTIEPDAPRKFVVEVRAGFADRFGLTDSTRVRWSRSN